MQVGGKLGGDGCHWRNEGLENKVSWGWKPYVNRASVSSVYSDQMGKS